MYYSRTTVGHNGRSSDIYMRSSKHIRRVEKLYVSISVRHVVIDTFSFPRRTKRLCHCAPRFFNRYGLFLLFANGNCFEPTTLINAIKIDSNKSPYTSSFSVKIKTIASILFRLTNCVNKHPFNRRSNGIWSFNLKIQGGWRRLQL